jgi:glycerol kinase
MAGDQQAALFGQTCFDAGEAKCTYGTGSFLLMNTGDKQILSNSGLLTTVGWQLEKDGPLTFALEGSVFICGAAVQWLRDGVEFFEESPKIEALAGSVEDAGGVEFVPALTGLGAPHWDPHARGMICGLTRGTTRAHIARATLEAMALQNAEILLAMEKDSGKKLKGLRVDGGASANNLLMQLQANYLGSTIIRPSMIETTAAGAAYLAGLGIGFWSDLHEIQKIWSVDREFSSAMTPKERKLRFESWNKAIKRVRL